MIIEMKKSLLLLTMAFCGLTCFGQTEQKTWTYGDHTYTQKGTLTAQKYDGKAKGVVTFTNVPSDYEEFEALYTEFLGKTPHGTAAMMVTMPKSIMSPCTKSFIAVAL